MTRYTSLALAAAMLTACARPTPEQQVVSDAAAALGGAERLLAVKNARHRRRRNAVQPRAGYFAECLGPDIRDDAVQTCDRRARANGPERSSTRVPKFTFWQGLAPQRQVQGIDKAIGYNVAANGTASRVAAAAADDRRAELLRHPITAVRAALDPAARLANVRNEGERVERRCVTSDGRAFTLAVDATTKLPIRVSTRRPTTSTWATYSSARRLLITRPSGACSFPRA